MFLKIQLTENNVYLEYKTKILKIILINGGLKLEFVKLLTDQRCKAFMLTKELEIKEKAMRHYKPGKNYFLYAYRRHYI